MSSPVLRQSAYVVITDRCPIGITTEGDDYVEINCGRSRDDHFEFVLHREALRTIINLGAGALRRMDNVPADTATNTAADV